MSDLQHEGRLYRLVITHHAARQMTEKGFQLGRVRAAFADPKEVYASGSHLGQHRVTGKGVCLVGEFRPEQKTFVLVTVYADRIITPPRLDQMLTPEGREYAQQYATGTVRRAA